MLIIQIYFEIIRIHFEIIWSVECILRISGDLGIIWINLKVIQMNVEIFWINFEIILMNFVMIWIHFEIIWSLG